jgi:hypothetical protein
MTQRTLRTQSALRKSIEKTQEHSPFDFAQGRQEWLCHKKRGAQRDTLLIVSGCAPRRQVHCGENSSGRNQRRGSAPGQIEFEAQRWPLRSLWLNPALCDSPVYRRGAKSNGRKPRIWAVAEETFGRMGLRYKSGSYPSHAKKSSGRRQRLERIRRGVASAAKRNRTEGRELPPAEEVGWCECWRWRPPARRPRRWLRGRRHREIRR